MASFTVDTTPWCGGPISATVQCVRANNPSPMTYVGTNTWIIAREVSPELAGLEESACSLADTPTKGANEHNSLVDNSMSNGSTDNAADAEGMSNNATIDSEGISDDDTIGNKATATSKGIPCIVVDPAPAGEQSATILETCRKQNLTIAALVLTHHHIDHTEGARELSQATGAPIYARDTETVPGSLPLPAGDFCPFEGASPMCIVDLPGHSPDSVGILLPNQHALITGDVVFRHGPTVVYYPEGHLGSYLATLDTLDQLIAEKHLTCFLPGHGYPLDNPAESIAATRQHRLERLEQIRAALASGVPAHAEDVYRVVYQGTDPRLKDAAIRSIKAQLEYLDCQEKSQSIKTF